MLCILVQIKISSQALSSFRSRRTELGHQVLLGTNRIKGNTMKLCGPGSERPPHGQSDGAYWPPAPSQGAGSRQEPSVPPDLGPSSYSYFRVQGQYCAEVLVPGGCADLKASLEHSGVLSESCKRTRLHTVRTRCECVQQEPKPRAGQLQTRSAISSSFFTVRC